MFQELLNFLPAKLGTIALIVSVFGSMLGVVLWLAGARFSRGILTLAAVGLGTIAGLRLPAWSGWSIDPMGPAVGGAVILGVSAFALHRVWVGAWLGVLLSCWSGLALWAVKARDVGWSWPDFAGKNLPQYLMELWHALPDPMRKYLPLVAGASMAVGIGSAILWPRMGTMLFWSFAGVSLLVVLGSAVMASMRPATLGHLPRQLPTQCGVLAGLVAIGALMQWKLTPRAKAAGHSGGEKKKESKD